MITLSNYTYAYLGFSALIQVVRGINIMFNAHLTLTSIKGTLESVKTRGSQQNV